MNKLRSQLGVLFQRGRFDRDLAEEMRSHIEMQAAENRADGLASNEAFNAARRQFGNLTLLAEEGREVWGFAATERILRDIHFAVRLLARNPGFTAAAVLTLALGVGVNSAIFSLVDAFLLRSAPVKDADRLLSIADRTPTQTGRPISFPNFLDWERENQVFEAMAAYRVSSFVIADDGGAYRVPGMEVSAGFFELLHMRPAMGRTFAPEEHRLGVLPVAIISHELWQTRFGGASAMLGKTLTFRGQRIPVVGVASAGFRVGPRADVYLPLETPGSEGRGSGNSLYGIGRLKAGVTRGQAQAQMDAIAARLEELYPQTNHGHRVDLIPFGQLRRGEIRRPLLMLFGAVAMVLLIACANLSNLLLAKAAGRGREIAMRKALGASRGRLVAQLLTESLVLSALGGTAGVLFGMWGCRGLLRLAGDLDNWPGGAPLGGIGMDGRVLGFTLVVALLTGIAMGLVPALHASKASLNSRAVSNANRRVLDVLVACEVALALVLLSGAGLLMRSFYNIVAQDRGFDAAHVLTLSLARAEGRQSEEASRRALEEIGSIPGVESAAGAFPLPFGHGFSGDYLWPEGRTGRIDSRMHYVTPGYFQTLRMHLRAGRWLGESDHLRGAVINEILAREAWPGEDPLGRRFRLGVPAPSAAWITVVGIAADTKENGLDSETGPEIYMPVTGTADILVRSAGDPVTLVPAIRARIQGIDRAEAVYDIYPLKDLISESVRGNRILAWLLAMFAGLAALLAAVGIFAVISHSVTRRTQELGIRLALGAEPADVRNLVLRQGMARVLAGLILGAAGAWAATRALSAFLYGVSPGDPVTLLAVAAGLGSVALLACYVPARRATRIDPTDALRHE